MSLQLDEFVFTGETPWHGLGVQFDERPESVKDIIKKGHLDWTVNTAPMYTELHPDGVLNYKAIYREDNNHVLGIVNSVQPIVTQNEDMFGSLSSLYDRGDIALETAASLADGKRVFGCFKIADGYKCIDDDIDHYLVVINEHTKVDGKITILNTPVRVVCQNTLIQALSNNIAKYRIKCTDDSAINDRLARKILDMTKYAKEDLERKAKKMLDKKVTREEVDKILDELFPFIKTEGESTHDKANERVEQARMQFIECMGADNLGNYRGTQYQIFNALTDFSQHYSRDAEFGLDLEKRMNMLPGSGVESPASVVTKFMNLIA